MIALMTRLMLILGLLLFANGAFAADDPLSISDRKSVV